MKFFCALLLMLAMVGCKDPVVTYLTPAQSADSFVDSIGLNVHFGYYGSVYTEKTPDMLAAIDTLRIRHLRDQMLWQDPAFANINSFYLTHQKLAAKGIKTEFQVTDINYPMSQVVAFPAYVKDLEAVEPTNEYDNSGDPNWGTNIRKQQSQLYTQIKSSHSNAIVMAAAPAQPNYAGKIGDISSIADVGNSHAYFEGWNPGNDGKGKNNAGYFVNWATKNTPWKPVWVSETGFWSKKEKYWGGAGNGETLQATYLPRALLEFYEAGAARTYIYELADYDAGDYFGLMRTDGTMKPGFYAVSNLLKLLEEPGVPVMTGSLDYSLSNAPSQVHQALFVKSNSVFYLALWVESSGMDVNNLLDTPVATQNITLNLKTLPTSVAIYQWADSGNTTATVLTPSKAIKLPVGPNLLVVRLQ